MHPVVPVPSPTPHPSLPHLPFPSHTLSLLPMHSPADPYPPIAQSPPKNPATTRLVEYIDRL